jgi:hypothetical protein
LFGANSLSPWGLIHTGCWKFKPFKKKTEAKLKEEEDKIRKEIVQKHTTIQVNDEKEQEDSLKTLDDQKTYLKRLEELEVFRLQLEKNFADTSFLNSINNPQP